MSKVIGSNSLDVKTRRTIESLAWDFTVGAGNVGEDIPETPGIQEIVVLGRTLKHPVSPDELEHFGRSWLLCLQAASQP
jgi:hypothetical protein